jgi:hypothetical protein
MQYLLIIPILLLLLRLLLTEDVVMGIFLRKLAVDYSAEGIWKITDKLKEAGIHHQVVTVRSRGSLGSSADAQAYAKSNIAMYQFSNKPDMVYYVFVSRKNYQRAKDLMA